MSLTDAYFDNMLEGFELAAREIIEQITGRILTECTYSIYLDQWPDSSFSFINGPVKSIESIEYLKNGETQTVDPNIYFLGKGRNLSQSIIKIEDWPMDRDIIPESIQINYTVGAKSHRGNQAIKLLVAHWFENRESVIVGTIASAIPHAYQAIINSLKI